MPAEGHRATIILNMNARYEFSSSLIKRLPYGVLVSSHLSSRHPSTSGTGSIVGSRIPWIAAGSPPESMASRASSMIGCGGHQIISFSSRSLHFRRPSSLRLRSLLSIKLLDFSYELGENGTRNRKQDLRSWARLWLIFPACSLLPRSERTSGATFLGQEEEEEERKEKKKEEDEETAAEASPSPRCLIPLPVGYKIPVSWPKSRDMIWFDNVPHPKLVEYKKDQNWVQKSGEYLVFPGGGTQFKEGVTNYIEFIEQILPSVEWGKHTRVILDVGCGVASFGGYLLEKGVITMSFAPKDEHEAQIQFALERGIPATLLVIGTQRLTFPDNVFDAVHCARCRVHWDADGGKPLLELNRILRPGGYFMWSATPVYRDDERDQSVWNAMVALTESMCWRVVMKTVDSTGIGVVIYQKPVSNSCYRERNVKMCDQKDMHRTSWYLPLDGCLPQIPEVYSGPGNNWPKPWPERLNSKPSSLFVEASSRYAEEKFYEDTKEWSALVSDTYFGSLAINWSSIRNVMDMNAGYGGFAAALINQPLWVMNIVPMDGPDTLAIIFDRGLIGIYHDWCESLSTYPRTYDLLHSSFLFGNLTQRCDIVDVVVEMDRILRPGGWVLVQDTMAMINRVQPVMRSLRWETTIHQHQFLVGRKGFWRPAGGGGESQSP